MNTNIQYTDNKASKTLVSFTGIRSHFEKGGLRKEFIGLTKQSDFNLMFVTDREVSWYNTIDVNLIKSKLTDQEEIITIGNSMGGYNAIQFTNDINVTKAIAFGPQYSVHPNIVPREKRWRKWTKAVKHQRYKHLKFNDTTIYYIFSGGERQEMYHTNMIHHQPNIHKFTVPGGHHFAKKLKIDNILYSLIWDCINETPEFVEKQYIKNIKRIKM